MLDYDPETRIKPLEAIHHPFFRKDSSLHQHSTIGMDISHGGSQPFYPPHIPTQTIGMTTAQEPMIISQEIVSLDTNQAHNHLGQSSELISGRHIRIQQHNSPPTAVFPPSDPVRTTIPQTGSNPYPIPMDVGHPVPVCMPSHLSPHHSSISNSYSPKFSSSKKNSPSGAVSIIDPSANNPHSFHHSSRNGSLPQKFYGTNALFNENDPQFSFSFTPPSHPFQPHSHPQTYHNSNGNNPRHSGRSHRHRRSSGQKTDHKEDSPMMGVAVSSLVQ